jgi:hypothetical protein
MVFAGEACSSNVLRPVAALLIQAVYSILSSPHHCSEIVRMSSLGTKFQDMVGDRITRLTASACYGLLWVFALQRAPFSSKREKLLSNIAQARFITLKRMLEAMTVSCPSLAASN